MQVLCYGSEHKFRAPVSAALDWNWGPSVNVIISV